MLLNGVGGGTSDSLSYTNDSDDEDAPESSVDSSSSSESGGGPYVDLRRVDLALRRHVHWRGYSQVAHRRTSL